MNIVTGYRGVPHVTSQQDRYINQSAYGVDSYVLPIGSQLAASIDSATQITLADGGVSAEGCVAVIEYGQSESLAIESGTAGMDRHDLICARYTKDTSGIEDVQLIVLTGVPTTGTAADPEYNAGSIAAGDTIVDFPIYRVIMDGIAIDSVVRVGAVSETIATLTQKNSQITNAVSIDGNGNVHFKNLQVGIVTHTHATDESYVTTQVTFPTPFNGIPYVFADAYTTYPDANFCGISGVSATGFSITTYRRAAGSQGCRWLAFR